MTPYEIDIPQEQLTRATLLLSAVKNGASKAIARAINKTLAGVKTDASAEIRAVVTARKKDVDKTFKIIKASSAGLMGGLRSTGRPLPLIAFSPRKTLKGVSIQVRKDRPRKIIPHTFKATVYGKERAADHPGHEGVFWRKIGEGGKRVARLPIEERYGPRVPDILSNEPVMARVLASAKERMDKNMAHEIDYELLRSNL